ncbi:MAG: hypothetical protein JWO60_2207 [Frankiales bacterium]|nr:hypothetical protein [Frankiales bacterium]
MSSRTTRLVSALVLAGAAVPLVGVAPAHAATEETASSAGYFSVVGPQDTGTPAGTPPNAGTMADGVAPGNLAVAGGSGQEQKISFLLFPGEGLEPGATVGTATLTVPLAEGDGNLSASAAPEKVRACAIDDTGFGGEDGASLMVAPVRKCDVFSAPGKASPDAKSYVFDITGLAKTWTEQNDGLALTVAEGADTTPFQVVFQSGDKARLSYDATAPAGTDAGTGTGTDDGADASTGSTAGSTGGTGTTDLGGGFGAGSDLGGTPDLGSTGSTGEVPLTAPLDAAPGLPVSEVPAAGPAPETAPEAAPAQTTLAAASEPSLTPGAGFWLGLGALGAVLALVSLVLGDGEVPRATTSTSRLSRALEARQSAAASDRPRALALS